MQKLRLLVATSVVLAGCSLRLLLAAGPDPQLFGEAIRVIDYTADQPLDRAHFDPLLPVVPGSILTRTAVKECIQALYDTGRFSTIAAEAVPHPEGVRLIFRLSLNYYFNRFSVEGARLSGRQPLWEVLALPVGERFTDEKVEAARQAVAGHMRDRGYLQAEVAVHTTRDVQTRQVNTMFTVRAGVPATVKSLQISGVPPALTADIRRRLRFDQGKKYDRQRLRRRLDALKQYFVKEGFLAAVADVAEEFSVEDNTVALRLQVSNFGRVRVAVEGFRIEQERLRRLLPIFTGAGLQPELLDEGASNIKEYVEENGYPEARVAYREEVDNAGVRVLRYTIEPGRRVVVAWVRFKGNRALTDQELLSTAKTQPTRFLHRSVYSVARLDADVESLRALYTSRGYLTAEVKHRVEPVDGAEKLGITFECSEGPLAHTQGVEFKGNSILSSAFLTARMGLKQGSAYSPYLAERERQTLLAAYNDAGFLQARINYRTGNPDDHNSYPLAFEIHEGMRSYVSDVIILGNERTRRPVIESRIKLKKDEPLSLGKMLETQQALHNLQIFDSVRVGTQNPESIAPFQNVVVRVEETGRMTLRYGIGYHEREQVRGTVEVSDFNILGTGQRADLRLRGSRIEQGAALTFQQPQIRFLPVNSYFTVSFRKRREVSFDVTRANLSYQYSHALGGHTWALLRYSFDNVRVSTTDIPPQERENQPRNLSTFSFIYVNDTRDNYLDPEKGFFTSTDLSLTTKFLGGRNYLSLYTQNGYYRKLPASLLLAAGLKVGAARSLDGLPDLPISERFFAGGASSLRGFETDRAGALFAGTDKPQGGNALLVGNIELRVPVLRPVYLAGFYDVGNVFRRVGDIRLADFTNTVGIGLRIKTPFGPLRADYGINLNFPASHRAAKLSARNLFVTIGPPF